MNKLTNKVCEKNAGGTYSYQYTYKQNFWIQDKS